MRKTIGWLAACVAFLLTIYILLGLFAVVPLTVFQFMGASLVRLMAECAIVFYLIAAWAFWEI